MNNRKDNQSKFDAKSDERIFLDYSLHSKAYAVYNKRTKTVEESIRVAFDETNLLGLGRDVIDDIVEGLENTHINDKENEQKEKEKSDKETPQQEQTRINNLPKEWRTSKHHPLDNVKVISQKG